MNLQDLTVDFCILTLDFRDLTVDFSILTLDFQDLTGDFCILTLYFRDLTVNSGECRLELEDLLLADLNNLGDLKVDFEAGTLTLGFYMEEEDLFVTGSDEEYLVAVGSLPDSKTDSSNPIL